jgi:hypothetical protein
VDAEGGGTAENQQLLYDDDQSSLHPITRSNSENLTREDGLSNSRFAADDYGDEGSNSKWAPQSSSARY